MAKVKFRLVNLLSENIKNEAMKKYLSILFLCYTYFLPAQTWSPCGTVIGGPNNGIVMSLKSYNGYLYVGGDLDSVGGYQMIGGISRWTGTAWDNWFPTSDGIVYAMDTLNGKLYAGGDLQQIGSSWSRGISEWNDSTWSDMANGLDDYADPTSSYVRAIASYNGNIFAGGRFNEAAGDNTTLNHNNNIAEWSGSAWVGCDSGLISPVNSMVEYNGELYAGGAFTSAGSLYVNYIAKWNGTNWSACGSGMDNGVNVLCIYNGELYAGGYFTNAGGTPANHIAKWDGTNWAACGNGTDGIISSLKVFDGKLYVGGDFAIAGTTPANNIAAWDGSSWSSCGSGVNNVVLALEEFNGKLYAGGQFTIAGNNPANNIAMFDTTVLGIQNPPALNSGVNFFPNPFSISSTLKIESQKIHNATLSIYDISGKSVRTITSVISNTIEIEKGDLLNGIYFYSLSDVNGEIASGRFIIAGE
jgi:hypothetical protein